MLNGDVRWSETVYLAPCCHRNARASEQALKDTRGSWDDPTLDVERSGDDHIPSRLIVNPLHTHALYSDLEVAETWDVCLHCATGEHYPGEYPDRECAVCDAAVTLASELSPEELCELGQVLTLD